MIIAPVNIGNTIHNLIDVIRIDQTYIKTIDIDILFIVQDIVIFIDVKLVDKPDTNKLIIDQPNTIRTIMFEVMY